MMLMLDEAMLLVVASYTTVRFDYFILLSVTILLLLTTIRATTLYLENSNTVI